MTEKLGTLRKNKQKTSKKRKKEKKTKCWAEKSGSDLEVGCWCESLNGTGVVKQAVGSVAHCHQLPWLHVDVHTVAVTTHTPLMTRAIKITTHTTKYPCHQLPWLREDVHAIAVTKRTHHWQPVPPKQQHGPQVTYEYDIKTRTHATDDPWHQNNTHQWWPMTSKQQHTPLMTYDIKTTTHTNDDLWHQNNNTHH